MSDGRQPGSLGVNPRQETSDVSVTAPPPSIVSMWDVVPLAPAAEGRQRHTSYHVTMQAASPSHWRGSGRGQNPYGGRPTEGHATGGGVRLHPSHAPRLPSMRR
eukprot:scaffold3208_cov402-Prasinococcus_capsulatus_cf.AAC.15